MESILLVSLEGAERKRLKNHLIKRGFEVTALGPMDLDELERAKGRFAIGIVDSAATGRFKDLIDQVHSQPITQELPVMALLSQGQLKELNGIGGLEDFLLVPAAPELIETRLRFLLRRLNQLSPGSGIRIGALELNADRYEVLLKGEPLELTYKEFELFKFLATHSERVFSRDQLLNQVWGYDFIGGTRTVDVHIRRLRAKLGPKYASLIATVRNVGYKFLESL